MFNKTFIVVGLLVLAFTVPTSASEDWTGNQLSEEGERLYVPNANQQAHLAAYLLSYQPIIKAYGGAWDLAGGQIMEAGEEYGRLAVSFSATGMLTEQEFRNMENWVSGLFPINGSITSDFKKTILNDLFNQIPEDLWFSADGDEDLATTWLDAHGDHYMAIDEEYGSVRELVFRSYYFMEVKIRNKKIKAGEIAAAGAISMIAGIEGLKDVVDKLASGEITQEMLEAEQLRIKSAALVEKLNAALETAADVEAKDAAEAAIAKAVEDSLTGAITEVICVDSGGFAQVCF